MCGPAASARDNYRTRGRSSRVAPLFFAPPAAKSAASGRAPLQRGHGRCSAKRPGNFGPPHTPRTAVSGRSGHSVGHAGRLFRRFSSPRKNPVLRNGQSCPRADETAPAPRPRKALLYPCGASAYPILLKGQPVSRWARFLLQVTIFSAVGSGLKNLQVTDRRSPGLFSSVNRRRAQRRKQCPARPASRCSEAHENPWTHFLRARGLCHKFFSAAALASGSPL